MTADRTLATLDTYARAAHWCRTHRWTVIAAAAAYGAFCALVITGGTVAGMGEDHTPDDPTPTGA